MNQHTRAAEVGVLVLGVHRSGTSTVSRLVNLLGVPLSTLDDISSRPDPSNQKGHWESAALRDVNDSLLRSLGGDVWAPPNLEPGWADRVDEPFVKHATQIFRSVYLTPQWVWKDPRNCLTLPFWQKHVVARPVCIVTYRNPIEVAESLARRDSHAKALGLAVWDRYTRDLLRNVAGLPAFVASFDDLIDDPVGWFMPVSEFLDSQGVSLGPLNERSILDFVDSGLRTAHTKSDALDSDPLTSLELRDLYVSLENLKGPHKRFPAATLPEQTGWMPALLEERRLRGVNERRSQNLQNKLARPPRRMKVAQREAALADEVRRQTRRANELQARLTRLTGSRSFRYARPLRVLASKARRFRARG